MKEWGCASRGRKNMRERESSHRQTFLAHAGLSDVPGHVGDDAIIPQAVETGVPARTIVWTHV